MATDYEPGTVAVATVQGQANVRVVRVPRRDEFLWMRIEGRYSWATDEEVTDVRPLVVLDPYDREQAERFARGYIAIHQYSKTPWEKRPQKSRDTIVNAVQGAFRSLAAPPKPPEPTGLGAVVRDSRGYCYIRGNPASKRYSWVLESLPSWAPYAKYDDLDVVEVLSPGVSP